MSNCRRAGACSRRKRWISDCVRRTTNGRPYDRGIMSFSRRGGLNCLFGGRMISSPTASTLHSIRHPERRACPKSNP